MGSEIKFVSVLMPTYNCSRYIIPAVRSILNQTFREFELVIIDDGSGDNTEELISQIKDSRVRYIKTEHKGLAAALNYGIGICESDWIARMDSDDLNSRYRLEKQIRFLEQNSDYDIVSSWSVYFNDKGRIMFLLKPPVSHNEIIEAMNIHNPVNHSGVIYRKKIISENKYNENYTTNEDYELFYRLRDYVRFYNIPEFLVYTRIRKNSNTYPMNNSNLYEMLFNPAFKNLIEAKSKGQAFYWTNIIAWLNYFYGDRKNSRGYFRKSASLRNYLAYITTFLPSEYFHKFISMRLRYRLESFFVNKSLIRQELNALLNQ